MKALKHQTTWVPILSGLSAILAVAFFAKIYSVLAATDHCAFYL